MLIGISPRKKKQWCENGEVVNKTTHEFHEVGPVLHLEFTDLLGKSQMDKK